MKNWKAEFRKISEKYPRAKKIIGVALIIMGLLALITPFTPGSWLVFVGLEFLGIRMAAWEKIKAKFMFLNSKKGKFFIFCLMVLLAVSATLFLKNKKVQENPSPKPEAIEVAFPKPNNEIVSPLTVTGQARGTWFFEASFPVVLTDWDGKIIASGIATAKEDWMTENFVPFEATLTFTKPAYKNNGFLILKKDNPSGLPEFDQAYEIPISFK